MLTFIKKNKPLSIAFALALAATLVFTFRLAASAIYWSDPSHREQPVAGWMTPRYVSRSWNVPPDVIAGALNLELEGGAGRLALAQIADRQDRDVGDLVADLETAIAAHRNATDE